MDYRFLIVNPAFEKLTGLRAGSIIGRTLREVLPDAESCWVERYGRVALDGQPEHFEDYSKNLQKHFEMRAFSPAPKQFAVILHDITQHKNAEEIKKKMQQDYESLIQNRWGRLGIWHPRIGLLVCQQAGGAIIGVSHRTVDH